MKVLIKKRPYATMYIISLLLTRRSRGGFVATYGALLLVDDSGRYSPITNCPSFLSNDRNKSSNVEPTKFFGTVRCRSNLNGSSSIVLSRLSIPSSSSNPTLKEDVTWQPSLSVLFALHFIALIRCLVRCCSSSLANTGPPPISWSKISLMFRLNSAP